MSKILAMFNEEDEDYMSLIENPRDWIDFLIGRGEDIMEPVTISSINALITLVAHQNLKNTLIVTNKEYDDIIKNKNLYMDVDDTEFQVPIESNSSNLIKIEDLKGWI